MDFKTYCELIEKFGKVVEQEYPNQHIINTFKPRKCPCCGRALTLSTVWTCEYVEDHFADKCDVIYEWIDGGHYNYPECCGAACPSYHKFWCEDLRERDFAFFCLDCEKVLDKEMKEVSFCSECPFRFSSI